MRPSASLLGETESVALQHSRGCIEEGVINTHIRPITASCVLAAALGLPLAVVAGSPASALEQPAMSAHVSTDDMGGMGDPTPAPTTEPMHDMETVTGDVDAPDMAGASHVATSPAPDAHDGVGGDGHDDGMSDMTSDDSSGHGGPMVATPAEPQRKVVLAGFAAVNLLVFAGAGVLRRTGHGSRSQKRVKQGTSATPRRTRSNASDTGEQE